MDNKKEAIMIAKKNGAKYIVKRPDWKEKEVWEMVFTGPDDEFQCIGIPSYIFFSGENAKLSDDSEAMDYLEFLNSDSEDDEEDEPEFIKV